MIRVDPCQPQLLKEEIYKFFVLEAERLFEVVKCFQEFPYHILICFSLNAFRHLYIDKLVDEVVQKSCFNIYLVYVLVKKGWNSKENFKNYGFYYSCKGLIKVYSKLLKLVFHYLSGLKTSNIIIYIPLYLIYPFVS